MKVLFILALIAAVASSSGVPEKITEIEKCHCQSGFVARGTRVDGYRCVGLRLKIITSCNIVPRPQCVCTDATGILNDPTGTWCTRYEDGKELRKWDCENAEEWKKFFLENPDQRPAQSN